MIKCITLFLALGICSASADTIRSSNGKTAQVASEAAGPFQCLINKLDSAGYRIDFMGGWRKRGSVRHSLHPAGMALDINQTARNRVTRSFPMGVNEMASSCGAFHGSQWSNPDTGHFQVGGYQGRHSHHRRHHRHRRH